MVVEQILTEAMHLPKPSRAFMAEKIDAGRMKMIPAAQVFTSIRRSLRQ